MRVTPLVWISFGLVSLTISVMMAGDWLVDLVPNHDRQVFEYRRDLAESLAIQYSALAEREQIETVKFAMETLAKRIPDILSLALLQKTGRLSHRLATMREYGFSRLVKNPPSSFSKFRSFPVTNDGACFRLRFAKRTCPVFNGFSRIRGYASWRLSVCRDSSATSSS